MSVVGHNEIGITPPLGKDAAGLAEISSDRFGTVSTANQKFFALKNSYTARIDSDLNCQIVTKVWHTFRYQIPNCVK
jgi:hypothetical protein